MKSEFLLQNQSINYVPDEDSYFSSSSTSNSTVVLLITDLRVSGPASASDLFTFPFFDRSRAAVAVTGGAMNLIPSEWRQTQRGLSRLPHHYRLQTYRNSPHSQHHQMHFLCSRFSPNHAKAYQSTGHGDGFVINVWLRRPPLRSLRSLLEGSAHLFS